MSDITVIGAVVTEVEGNLYEQLMFAEENSGAISTSCSGNGRNIAENLGRLNADVAFATTVGNDFIGRAAKIELESLGINTESVSLVDGQNSALHVQILNLVGDLDTAVGNWDVYQCMNEKFIEALLPKLNASRMVAVDCTCPKESLEFLTEKVTAPLFLDPATESDAEKVKDIIGKFHTIAPNRAEAAAITGLEIFSEDQLMAAGQWFTDKGVKRIFITLSGGGVYYKEGIKEGILRPEQMLPMANENGAGAAFSAAVLESFVEGKEVEETAQYAMAAAAVSLETKAAVNPNMSREQIEKKR